MGENDRRKYFMINLHERMLPTSAGVEPVTSWSPVGRRIQLSHRGRLEATWPCRKKAKCQCMTIILAILVDPLSPMIYANIQPQSILGSREEDL